ANKMRAMMNIARQIGDVTTAHAVRDWLIEHADRFWSERYRELRPAVRNALRTVANFQPAADPAFRELWILWWPHTDWHVEVFPGLLRCDPQVILSDLKVNLCFGTDICMRRLRLIWACEDLRQPLSDLINQAVSENKTWARWLKA